MLEDLFVFPIVMVDRMSIEKNKDLYSLDISESDLIIGEAEEFFYEIRSIKDQWLPTVESTENATKGIFNACSVEFGNNEYLSPMSKEIFKKKLMKFAKSREKNLPQSKVYQISKDELKDILNSSDE